MSRPIVFLLLASLLILSGLAGCSSASERGEGEVTKAVTPGSAVTPPTWLTLDGYDKSAGITVQEINLWKDHNDRAAGIAAVGKHGDRVKLVRRQGDGVLIELSSGKQGWVTYYFIKEYK